MPLTVVMLDSVSLAMFREGLDRNKSTLTDVNETLIYIDVQELH